MSANANRDKGHRAERYYAAKLRDLGYEKCLTSRYASKMHDDAGIDLVNIPLNLQIKSGKQAKLNPRKFLADMRGRIAEMFPDGSPERERPCAVLHRREHERGKKREEEDEMVYLTFSDLEKLLAVGRNATI